MGKKESGFGSKTSATRCNRAVDKGRYDINKDLAKHWKHGKALTPKSK
jgi:hypothetical protein